MARPDLNQLVTLDALLAEGNVARAARRLRLSPSAMSRALARLRKTTGDPLLVRAGRGLVLTPRAAALRDEVARLVRDAERLLHGAQELDLAALRRTFTLRTNEGFVETFGPALLARLAQEAPGVRLRFVPKPDRDGAPLREGTVDLETGVVSAATAPELRAHALFRDRFVGVVRRGHRLARGAMTAARYAAGEHIAGSRRGRDAGPVDQALAALGLERASVLAVASFASALALARTSDRIATVPERHTAALRAGMHTFPLPFPVPEITVSLLWHPRLDADPAHRWLRARVQEVCAEAVRAAGAAAPPAARAATSGRSPDRPRPRAARRAR